MLRSPKFLAHPGADRRLSQVALLMIAVLRRQQFGHIGAGTGNLVDATSSSIVSGVHNAISGTGLAGFIGAGELDSMRALNGAIVAGETNTVQGGAQMSIIGAGFSNKIDSTSVNSIIGSGERDRIFGKESVIGGGDTNTIWAGSLTAFADAIPGGYLNQIFSSDTGFIGGGAHNLISKSEGSAIVGGSNNQIAALGVAVGNYNFIGGGVFNWDKSQYASIAGGDSNSIAPGAQYGSVGGGHANQAIAEASTIPGGDSLISQSYAQTVVGYNNLPLGSVTKGTRNDFATSGTAVDAPLFVVGNGNDGNTQSNAFEVSYDGHTSVTQTNADANPPIQGANYTDNIVYAWGDVVGNTSPAVARTSLAGSSAFTQSFGITTAILHTIGTGKYTLVFDIRNADATTIYTLDGAALTVTLVDDGTEVQPCAIPLVLPLAASGGNSGQIEVDIYKLGSGGCGDLEDHSFMFHLTGRIH